MEGKTLRTSPQKKPVAGSLEPGAWSWERIGCGREVERHGPSDAVRSETDLRGVGLGTGLPSFPGKGKGSPTTASLFLLYIFRIAG